jgi:hypothetical protein
MPQRFTGAKLIEALNSYAISMEKQVRKSFLDAIANLTGQGDLPLMMKQLQQGDITPEDLPARIQQLSLDKTAFTNIIKKIVGASGTITAKEAGLEVVWDITLPTVLIAAGEIADKTFTEIDDTTMSAIGDTIENAIATGMSRDALVRTIKRNAGLLPSHVEAVDRYEQTLKDAGQPPSRVARLASEYAERLLKYRANMIARTETALARTVGQQQFWNQMRDTGNIPPDTLKVWITAQDERTCEICGPMNDVAVGLNDSWQTDNGPVEHPPEVHPNCRCDFGLVFQSGVTGAVEDLGWVKIEKANPYHDELGRFTSAGNAATISGMTSSMRGSAGHTAALASMGGFTFNQKRKEYRRTGLAVSPFKGVEETYSLDQWAKEGPRLVKNYLKKHEDILSSPNVHIGGWKGEANGKVMIFLDCSIVLNNHDNAAGVARRNDQIAYFDLETFTEYRRKEDSLYYSYDEGFLDPNEIGKKFNSAGVYFIPPQDLLDDESLLKFISAVATSEPIREPLSKFNPYHDELGRFSSADRASSMSGGVTVNESRGLPSKPEGPKKGQPFAHKTEPARSGVTGEPNPVTGEIMSNTEFGYTMETLFRSRAMRLPEVRKFFGGGLKNVRGDKRTGPLDFITEDYGLEIKSLNARNKSIRIVMDRQAAISKTIAAKELGLQAGLACQVVDFARGVVEVWGYEGIMNPSTKVNPNSLNIKHSPRGGRFTKLGEYLFTRKQWHEAQKKTDRTTGNVVTGSWGDYEPPDTMSKFDELAFREEVRKAHQESFEEEPIKQGDVVIQLVTENGREVPYLATADYNVDIKKMNPYHDARGRFTSQDKAVGPVVDQSIRNLIGVDEYTRNEERTGKEYLHWGYTFLPDIEEENLFFDGEPTALSDSEKKKRIKKQKEVIAEQEELVLSELGGVLDVLEVGYADYLDGKHGRLTDQSGNPLMSREVTKYLLDPVAWAEVLDSVAAIQEKFPGLKLAAVLGEGTSHSRIIKVRGQYYEMYTGALAWASATDMVDNPRPYSYDKDEDGNYLYRTKDPTIGISVLDEAKLIAAQAEWAEGAMLPRVNVHPAWLAARGDGTGGPTKVQDDIHRDAKVAVKPIADLGYVAALAAVEGSEISVWGRTPKAYPEHTTKEGIKSYVENLQAGKTDTLATDAPAGDLTIPFWIPTKLTPIQHTVAHELGHVVRNTLARQAPEALYDFETKIAAYIAGDGDLDSPEAKSVTAHYKKIKESPHELLDDRYVEQRQLFTEGKRSRIRGGKVQEVGMATEPTKSGVKVPKSPPSPTELFKIIREERKETPKPKDFVPSNVHATEHQIQTVNQILPLGNQTRDGFIGAKKEARYSPAGWFTAPTQPTGFKIARDLRERVANKEITRKESRVIQLERSARVSTAASLYAATNGHELWAELFAGHMGGNDHQLTKFFGAELDELWPILMEAGLISKHEGNLVKVFLDALGIAEVEKANPYHDAQGRFTSADKDVTGVASDAYQGQHKPPDSSYAPPLHDLLVDGSWFPKDVYSDPRHYMFGESDVISETLKAINDARGNPDKLITVYRSAPVGTKKINSGDWVSLSRSYAEQHGLDRVTEFWDQDANDGNGMWVTDESDWPILSAQVPAHTIRNGGNDLIEWGYWGKHVEDGSVSKANPYHDAQGRFTSQDKAVNPQKGQSGQEGGQKLYGLFNDFYNRVGEDWDDMPFEEKKEIGVVLGGTRALIKHNGAKEIAKEVAKSDPETWDEERFYEVASEHQQKWAGSAQNVALQLAMARIAGLSADDARARALWFVDIIHERDALIESDYPIDERTKDFIKDIDDAHGEYGINYKGINNTDPMPRETLERIKAIKIAKAEGARAFVKAHRDLAQKQLKDAGIEYVTLYRGVQGFDEQLSDNWLSPDESSPLASWTYNEQTAETFALIMEGWGGQVIKMTVPAEAIVGLSINGWGCIAEKEVIVDMTKATGEISFDTVGGFEVESGDEE